MSKRNRRSKVNQTGRCGANKDFVLLHWWTLRSPAFRSLTGNAVKVLLDIWDAHKGPNHNGTIGYGVRDGAKLGLSKSETARALKELVEKGFLAITQDASFTHTKRIARRWRLTAEPTADAPATKEFMAWSGPAPAVDKSPKARERREPVAHDKPVKAPAKTFDSPARGTDSPARGTMDAPERPPNPPTVPRAGLSKPNQGALQSRPRDSLRSATPKGCSGEPEGLKGPVGGGGRCGHVDNPPAAGGGTDPELDSIFGLPQPKFGRAFSALREQRGISVEALADRLGVRPESWARVEAEGVQPARPLKQRARRALHEMNGAAL